MIGQDRAYEIKRIAINIVKTFRSLPILDDSDVKINALEKDNDNVKIVGEYQYKNIFDNRQFEKGTFDISLNESTLQPVNVKINPNSTIG